MPNDVEVLVEENEVTQEEVVEEKTYTQAELDSQISKSVESALSRRDKKHQSEMDAAIQKAVEDALSRETMSEKERMDADLQAREEAIAQREAEAERREFKAQVVGELQEVSLPISFAEMIVNSSDPENSGKLVDSIKKDIDQMIQNSLKEFARQPDPKTSETSISTSTTNVQGNLSKFAEEIKKGVK